MAVVIPSEGYLHEIRDVKGPGLTSVCPLQASCHVVRELEQLRERCSKLEELSFVDALTGLYNFRYMQKSIEMEMERTRRTRLPTGLIMIDLDYFKNINTLYGHERGNIVLAGVSRIIREGVRAIDVPCRYGGEEFALVLPGTSLVQAKKIAERLRATIQSTPVSLENVSVTVTASFGVAVFRVTDDCSVSKFVNRADNFLYMAKKLGRNRVCAEDLTEEIISDEVTREEKAALFTSAGEEE